jgi:hypothetical protein
MTVMHPDDCGFGALLFSGHHPSFEPSGASQTYATFSRFSRFQESLPEVEDNFQH